MSSVNFKSQRPTPNSSQFSIRSLLILTTVVGLGIAFPQFAFFAPVFVPLLLLVAILIIGVGAIQFIMADDRIFVLRYVWSNLKCILTIVAFLFAYMVYAYYAIPMSWSLD